MSRKPGREFSLYALDPSRTLSAQDDVGSWVLVRREEHESGVGFWYGARSTNRELGLVRRGTKRIMCGPPFYLARAARAFLNLASKVASFSSFFVDDARARSAAAL